MRTRSWLGFFFLLLFVIAGNHVWAQSTSSQTATQEVALLQHALWGNTAVHQAMLTGTATQYAGSDVEQGAVTLIATSEGSSSMELSLGNRNRKETANGLGPGRECQWSKDGTSHQMDYMNCLKPLVWFLPGITLQSGLMPSSVGVDSLSTVQVDGASYKRLQAQAVISGLNKALLKKAMKRSTMTLDLDPGTSLPERLSYSIRPNNGAPVDVRIEVRFSDYRKVDGAEIPFRIRRYVNGSLQLDIQISSASLS